MNVRRAVIPEAPPVIQRRRAGAVPPAPSRFIAHWLPLATAICGVAFQAALLVMWGARLTQRVGDLERSVAPLAGVPAMLARLDERSQQQGGQLDHLVAAQDRVALRRDRPPLVIDPPPIDANAVRQGD